MPRGLAIVSLALVLAACGGGAPSASVSPSAALPVTPTVAVSASPVVNLTAADRAEIAKLERRPLKLPAASKDGTCHQGPFTSQISPYADGRSETDVYGSGPVYGQGSPPIRAGAYN